MKVANFSAFLYYIIVFLSRADKKGGHQSVLVGGKVLMCDSLTQGGPKIICGPPDTLVQQLRLC